MKLTAPQRPHWQATLVVIIGCLVFFGGVFLVSHNASCRFNSRISFTRFHDPYVILLDHGLKNGLFSRCLKIIDTRDGNVLLQKHVPGYVYETALFDQTIVGVLADLDRFFQFDLTNHSFKLMNTNDLAELVPQASRVELLPEEGVLRVLDQTGRKHDVHPITLAPGSARSTPQASEEPGYADLIDRLRIPPEVRPPLLGPTGETIKEDAGLIHPVIVEQLQWHDGVLLVVLSYQTIEKKRWILTGMDETGAVVWQVTQDEVGNKGGSLLSRYTSPKFHISPQGTLLAIFQGRILRLDTANGSWDVFPSYRW